MSAVVNAIRDAIHRYGEPIELTVKETGTTHYLRASVQSETQDPLINDLDQAGYMVYIAAGDLEKAPAKFDRVLVRGVVTALDENARLETLEGFNVAYIVRTKG